MRFSIGHGARTTSGDAPDGSTPEVSGVAADARNAAAHEPLRQSPKDVLFSTWPGRLFLITAGLKFFVAVWRAFGELPAPIRVLSGAASIGLAVAVGVFVWRLFVLMKRTLLWRVRRKLILSYIFIGVVPSLLIIVFFLFCSAVLFMDVAAYLFKSGYDKVVDDVQVVAQAAATRDQPKSDDRSADDRASAPDSGPSISGAVGRLRRA